MTKVSPEGEALLSFEHRDPRPIYDKDEFRVAFHDVFGEPDPGVHSFEWVWKTAFAVFNGVRLWTYRILSLCGVCSACCFGLQYACTACDIIWCRMPLLNLMRMSCMTTKMSITICVDSVYGPIIRLLSFLCWNIRVTSVRDANTV